VTGILAFVVRSPARHWIGSVACCAVSTQIWSQAQSIPKPTEYQVKAAYLYNVARFVTWPASATTSQDNTVAMCVLGDDSFATMLETTGASLVIEGKPTIVRRLPTAEAAGTCSVLFISASARLSPDQVSAAIHQRGVLTVSDLPEFTRRGGIIQFVIEGSRIRFEVNLAAADQAGLTLSSDLLKVARAVRRTP
jgi:hypothetical protein